MRIARVRAFCPLSQIDTSRTADPALHVGKTYAFRIIEYKDGGKNIVVSRRKQLEDEQQANAAAVRKSIVPGAVLPGRVASVLDFGAFVDLGGGIQGLLHVSEMSWSRATTPGAVVAAGDQITVMVLRVDDGTGKISLGLKQLQDDPWSTVGTTYEVGQVRSGRVTRVAEFGAFVELEPGIEGLGRIRTGRYHRCVRDSQRRPRAKAHRRRAHPRRILTGRRCDDTTAPIRARHDRDREGGASRTVRCVRVPVAGANRPDAVLRNRSGSRRGPGEGVSPRK